MTTPSVRLIELGITLPTVAAPIAAYLPAVADDHHIYVSGQLPLVDGALQTTGRLGSDIDTEVGYGQARVCVLNGLAATVGLIGDIDRVTRVIRVGGFVACTPTFRDQAAVINGASELLAEIFGDQGRHARSAVGVAALPLNAAVEVELLLGYA
jgi:enamine deaminase RidA (YjgF/YER057c/UK114 family)